MGENRDAGAIGFCRLLVWTTLLGAVACTEPESRDSDEAPDLDLVSLPAAPGGAALRARPLSGSPQRVDTEKKSRVLRLAGDDPGFALAGPLGDAFEQALVGFDVREQLVDPRQAVFDVRNDKVDMLLTMKPLNHVQKNSGLIEHRVAHFVFVPVVHSRNALSSLSVEQLAAILTGNQRSWHRLSGVHLAVDLVGLSDDDLFQSASLTRFFPGTSLRTRTVESTWAGVLARVARQPSAVAFVPWAAARRASGIRVVPVGPRHPTLAEAGTGRAPLSWTLFLVTQERPVADVLRFIGFLRGDRAARYLSRLGFVAH